MNIKKLFVGLSSAKKIWILLAFALVLAMLWFSFVSNIQNTIADNPVSPEQLPKFNVSVCLDEDSFIPECQEREEALEAIKSFQELKKELIRINIDLWALEEFNTLEALVIKADQFFKKDLYAKSRDLYLESILISKELIQRASSLVDLSIEKGFNYLLKNSWLESESSFREALIIDPNNIIAIEGLKRSLALEQVLQYLDEASLLISTNSFDEAKILINKAFRLDNKNTDVIKAQQNVNRLIENRDLDVLITKGYNNLKIQNFSKALSNFKKAITIDSNAKAALAGIEATKEEIKKANIRREKTLAENSFELEDFKKSSTHYKNILKMDENIDFALIGLKQANIFSVFEQEMNRYLDKPSRLSTADVYIEAKELIKSFDSYELRTRLSGKKNLLIELLDKYSQKINLKILSDNKTQVTIKNIGTVGSFKFKEIKLIPGKYTLIGKRKGFVTIRKIIDLKDPTSIKIECVEKI